MILLHSCTIMALCDDAQHKPMIKIRSLPFAQTSDPAMKTRDLSLRTFSVIFPHSCQTVMIVRSCYTIVRSCYTIVRSYTIVWSCCTVVRSIIFPHSCHTVPAVAGEGWHVSLMLTFNLHMDEFSWFRKGNVHVTEEPMVLSSQWYIQYCSWMKNKHMWRFYMQFRVVFHNHPSKSGSMHI